jgi:hypothetical protein
MDRDGRRGCTKRSGELSTLAGTRRRKQGISRVSGARNRWRHAMQTKPLFLVSYSSFPFQYCMPAKDAPLFQKKRPSFQKLHAQ